MSLDIRVSSDRLYESKYFLKHFGWRNGDNIGDIELLLATNEFRFGDK